MSRDHTPNRMSRFRPQVSNPWESDSRAVTAIRNCLILAEQMGLRTMPKENEQSCAEHLANLPSTKLIEVQKEVSSKTETLYQLQRNIAAHVHDKEAGDFLQVKNIEYRINMITELCSDLDKVMQNTEALVHRLRKPFVGSFIKIDARYHK
ncbi:AUGMIN subunit 2-like [Elysia marginata]|uniref:AUGMIN subunit 2-like n=1 Tax=Elysia marginata TaxID=1093978 RepID=A0AAV4IJ21_9GAST|nr:AUGMIN subunit 2-like [Elysia marginata]